MTRREYIPAGFWIRGLARAINLLIIVAISYALLFAMVVKTNNVWQFRESYMFYIWSIFSIILLLFVFVGIPILTKGWSIGDKVCGLKIISLNNNLVRSILMREYIYAFGWAFTMLLVMIIVNHTLIFQISSQTTDPKSVPKLTVWEQTRISVVGTISSILTIVQIFTAITIIPNAEKRGFHDRISNSLISHGEKDVEVLISPAEIVISPKKINNVEIEWVGGKYVKW